MFNLLGFNPHASQHHLLPIQSLWWYILQNWEHIKWHRNLERNYVVGSYGQDSIKLGDLFTRLVTPDHELLGGFQTVSDNISSFFAVFNNDQQVSRHNNWSQKIPQTYCWTCSGCWQYVQFWLPTLGLWSAGSLPCKLIFSFEQNGETESIQCMMQAMSLTSVTRRDGTTGVEVWSSVMSNVNHTIKHNQSAGGHLATGSGWFWECALQPGKTSHGGCRTWCCRQGGGLQSYKSEKYKRHI